MDRTVIKNVISLAALQAASYIFPLITMPYLVRVLGAADYGRIGFAVAFAQYFVLFTNFGFNYSATRSIARCKNSKLDVSRIFWAATASKLFFCIIGALVLLALILTVSKLNADSKILWAAYLTVIGNALFPQWLFQGLERMTLIAVSNIIARSVLILPIFLFVQSRDDVVAAAVIQSGANIVAAIVSLWIVRREALIVWVRPPTAYGLELIRESWPLFLSSLASNLYSSTTVVVVGFIAGDAAVGRFVAVDKIREVVQNLINPVSQAFYPRICAMIDTLPTRAFQMIRRLLGLLGISTFFLSMTMAVCSGVIVTFALGPQYSDAIPTFAVIALRPFVASFTTVLGLQTMLPLGMNREFRNVLVGGGLVNLLLLMPLCTWYSDLGAAISVLASETLLSMMMGALLFKKRVPIFRSVNRGS
jgi:O-antigen/teichoic acid export membrane protein